MPIFKNEWKNLARDPDFAQAQHDFIQRSHHDPAVTKIKNSTGIDVCDGTWSNDGPGSNGRSWQSTLSSQAYIYAAVGGDSLREF